MGIVRRHEAFQGIPQGGIAAASERKKSNPWMAANRGKVIRVRVVSGKLSLVLQCVGRAGRRRPARPTHCRTSDSFPETTRTRITLPRLAAIHGLLFFRSDAAAIPPCGIP